MKALILAAGKGTRLYPMTKPVSKPLLPVYNKPLLYYPLCTLLAAGVRDIMIIVPPGHHTDFAALLGNGSQLGISIRYREQPVQRGIADAFLLAEDFIAGEPVCLILGDNIFYGGDLHTRLAQALTLTEGAVVFGYRVADPRPFGVVEFDAEGRAVSIEEKPEKPRSNYIVPGLYCYDGQVAEIARTLKPSARGELEITDVNLRYLAQGNLRVEKLSSETVWLDAGSADSVLDASIAVRELERRAGKYVGCIEEAALRRGFITREEAHALGKQLPGTAYGQYLQNL